ncbi:MAG: response regulator [bacterium]
MSLRVVLIEDNHDHIYLIKSLLEDYEEIGEVFVYEDAESALEGITSSNEKGGSVSPDFVLLDLKLPRMSGLDFLVRLRESENGMDTPVFVLTSSDRTQERKRSEDLGVLKYFVKPLTEENMEEILQRIAG